MTYEYLCDDGASSHVIEKFFKSFSEAAPFIDETICPEHGNIARRMTSVCLAPHLYGDSGGYHKPSPTKRYSTKVVDATHGNRKAVG